MRRLPIKNQDDIFTDIMRHGFKEFLKSECGQSPIVTTEPHATARADGGNRIDTASITRRENNRHVSSLCPGMGYRAIFMHARLMQKQQNLLFSHDRFYDPREFCLRPLTALLFIPFEGPPNGAFLCDFHAAQQPGDGRLMIDNAKFPPDLLTDRRQHPQRKRESQLLRSFRDVRVPQTFLLANGQFWRWAGCLGASKRLHSAGSIFWNNLRNRYGIDLQARRDVIPGFTCQSATNDFMSELLESPMIKAPRVKFDLYRFHII